MTITGVDGAARNATDEATYAEHRVRSVVDRPVVTRLARAGYVTKGIIYLIVAGLAGKVALGVHGETTDQSGALTALAGQPWGRTVLVVLALGLIVYGAWSIVQAFVDTQGDDQGFSAIAERIGYGVLGATYCGLAISALRLVIVGQRAPTSDDSAHNITAMLVGHVWGAILVGIAGLVLLGIAAGMFFQTVMARFRNTFDTAKNPDIPVWIVLLGRIGYAALGVVDGTVGIFLLVAAWQHDPNQAKGLGGALGALLARPHGPLLLGLIAVGLAAYGLFSFGEARYRCLDRR